MENKEVKFQNSSHGKKAIWREWRWGGLCRKLLCHPHKRWNSSKERKKETDSRNRRWYFNNVEIPSNRQAGQESSSHFIDEVKTQTLNSLFCYLRYGCSGLIQVLYLMLPPIFFSTNIYKVSLCVGPSERLFHPRCLTNVSHKEVLIECFLIGKPRFRDL